MKTAGRGRLGDAVLCLGALLVATGFLPPAYSVHLEVTSENITCILADLSINFTVEYKADKPLVASFSLPDNASVDVNSTCGKENVTAPLLVIRFGNNHSLSINFTKSQTSYKVDKLVFIYNLSDNLLFPGATENGTKEVSSDKTDIDAQTNNYYKCFNPHQVSMGNVNATFYNVSLEAYSTSKTFSANATSCSEDVKPTPQPTFKPTTAPSPTPPVNPKTPTRGEYRVNATSGDACLLANMGLQLNITYITKAGKDTSYVFNIEPHNVTASGTCTNSSSTLVLSSDTVYVLFNFTLNSTANTFFLYQVHANTTLPDAPEPNFIVDRDHLSYMQTATHKSYKCNSKQSFQITSNFSIDTYSLQVQPFDIVGSKFGSVVECSEDQNGMLVPIVVGACLAGLVLIVLVAYLIGRKRSHAGYQTI